MNEITFWDRLKIDISAIADTIDGTLDTSYVWVTNVKENLTWCSTKTKQLLGLPAQVIADFEQIITEKVHPYDRKEYLEKMGKRLQGMELDEELCIRFGGQNWDYSMFSIHTKAIAGEDDKPEYLVVTIRNEDIFPEFDARTDLYSYSRYVKDLERLMASGRTLAILQIQIEGFNTFNLVYGLDYSAKLLRAIALQFIYMMDMDKVVYRLEGERFVFVLKDAGREELLNFEQQVRYVLDSGIEVNEKLTSLKMSAGAILLEDYKEDTSSVRGQVAYALDHSIHMHQGQLVIFNDEVKTARGVDLALMRVIHQSVQNHCDGFYLEYQPIVVATTGEVVGAEALVRWKKDPYGVVPPGMFIEWMETDPSMYDLGNFVLRTALTQIRELLESRPDFFVNVNLSVRQLERPEFREELLAILSETAFPADHLCLELTERCKDFPMHRLSEEVAFFQNCGIRVALDDYGTGSASSSLVMNIPMDEIKIDMSFIRNIMDNERKQEMVRGILHFANRLHIATCVEGIENEELQNYLRSFHATWFQGYYYAKPLSVDSLEEMVKKCEHQKN